MCGALKSLEEALPGKPKLLLCLVERRAKVLPKPWPVRKVLWWDGQQGRERPRQEGMWWTLQVVVP